VLVTVEPPGNVIIVGWAPSTDAVSYQLERIDTAEILDVETSPVEVPISDGERPCVVVRAIGLGGKMSQASPITCAE
jgi:hypothetical protein